MAKEPTKRQWETAYHEAGHAVAAHLLEVRYKYVTIIPDEDSSGHLRPFALGKGIEYSLRARQRLEPRIMAALAGPIAAATYRGRQNHRAAASDDHQVTQLAMALTGSSGECEAYIRWLTIRIRDMLTTETAWWMVEALAAALIERKHIPFGDARQIMIRAANDPEKIASRRERLRAQAQIWTQQRAMESKGE